MKIVFYPNLKDVKAVVKYFLFRLIDFMIVRILWAKCKSSTITTIMPQKISFI